MDMSLSKLRELVVEEGTPGVLRFMGSQRVGHNWVTELNWTELKSHLVFTLIFMVCYHSSNSQLLLQVCHEPSWICLLIPPWWCYDIYLLICHMFCIFSVKLSLLFIYILNSLRCQMSLHYSVSSWIMWPEFWLFLQLILRSWFIHVASLDFSFLTTMTKWSLSFYCLYVPKILLFYHPVKTLYDS